VTDRGPRLQRTAQAETDLIQIWAYIARDNPPAADQLLDLLDAKSLLLARNPMLGMARDDLAKSLRYFPVGRYLILYRIISGGIEVVRVVHGMRRLLNLV
jgi:toxin ParE1/3/4